MCFLKQILYCFVILHTFKSPFNLHNFGYDKTDERDSINKRDRRPTGYILDQMHPPKPQTFKQLVLSCLFSLAVMCSCMQNTWQMLAGVGWKKFALDDRTVLRVHSAWMSSRGAPNPSPHGYQKGDTKTKKKNIKLNTHLQLERARFGEAVIRGFLTDFTSTLCSLLWVDDWEPCEAQQQQEVLGFSFQSSLTG